MSSRLDPVLYDRFSGLKNIVSEERLAPEDLAVGQNIDLDDSGHSRRRRGFAQVVAGAFHSLFEASRERVYGVKDGELSRIYPDFSVVGLGTQVGQRQVVYTAVGEEVFFTSSETAGVIQADDSVIPWGQQVTETYWESPVLNPTTNLQQVGGKLLSRPPTADTIAHLNGRIYLGQGSLLWATELYRYHDIDRNANYKYFESPIVQIIAVTDGLYVGTDSSVYFLAGSFRDMVRTKICESAMVPNSALVVDIKRLPVDIQQGDAAVMFLTGSGLYVGLDSGISYNFTEERFNFPGAQSAAAMYRTQDGMSHYVGVLGSSGAPVANARFGDLVEAEVRRFTES